MFDWLNKTMEQPVAFGTFHLIFFGFFLLLAVVLLVYFRKVDDKKFRTIVLIGWIIIVVFEIGKQILVNYDFTNDCFNKTFNWDTFPYQFCSLPLYIWPFTIFMKDSKIRDIINMFIGTFLFFGGFAYFFFPVSFGNYVYLNIQTMVHHGTQATICLFIFVHEIASTGDEKMNIRNYLKSIIVLLIVVGIAVGLNVLVTLGFNAKTNLFELNPIVYTEAMVFTSIVHAVGYPLFLLIYIVGFIAFGGIVYLAVKYLPRIKYLFNKKMDKVENNN